MQKIDYAKLRGFATVSDELSEGVDFVNATLGAKVGVEAMNGPAKINETAVK